MKKILVFALIVATCNLSAQVLLGVDVLKSNGFEQLRGKRIGLITNPTGVDKNLRSTIDILSSSEARAAGVKLTALFAPEHGVRGDIEAGKVVSDITDNATGATVYSLYGNGNKPKPEMLKNLDAIVFDIQDIGSRSYTFISTMGLAMEAAAEAGIEFIVLDRPNPLGGNKIEGVGVAKGFSSFVSKYNIPYIHGLTIGELARLYVGEGFLKSSPKLTVVPMQGWTRSAIWPQTGLEWVPTSPHIPQWGSSISYPITGMVGELQTINIGVGYTMPFALMGAVWIDNAEALAKRLNGLGINGVIFRPIHYRPYYGSGKDKLLHGVQIHIIDIEKAPLTLLGLYVLQELHQMYPANDVIGAASQSRIDMYDKVMGSSAVRQTFVNAGYKVNAVVPMWNASATEFRARRAKYLLY